MLRRTGKKSESEDSKTVDGPRERYIQRVKFVVGINVFFNLLLVLLLLSACEPLYPIYKSPTIADMWYYERWETKPHDEHPDT